MTTGVVVGGVLLAGDQLLGVEELTVGTGTDLIDDGGLQIDEDGTWDVLASAGLGEEGVEGIVTTTDGLVGWHLNYVLAPVIIQKRKKLLKNENLLPVRRAGCRAQGSTIPSRHYRSGHQPGQRGLKCTLSL